MDNLGFMQRYEITDWRGDGTWRGLNPGHKDYDSSALTN